MNYTLIKYIEDYRYINRCGDWEGEEGSFDIEFSRDKEEFAKLWASAMFNGANSDHDVQILINGAPDRDLNDEEDLLYWEVAALKDVEYQKLQLEFNNRQKALALEKEQRRIAEQDKHIASQKAAKLAQFESLKKELGL